MSAQTPEIIQEIEHLDFDVPCERCKIAAARFIVRLATVHGCRFDGWQAYYCGPCSRRSGVCNACGTSDRLEVL